MGWNKTIKASWIGRINVLVLSISVFDNLSLENNIINTVTLGKKNIYYRLALWSFPMIKKNRKIYKYSEQADIFVTDGRLFLQACFTNINNYIRYFNKQHYSYIGKLIPNTLPHLLGRLAGWHRLIKANKLLVSTHI